jgi:hypothetical protein
MLILVQKFCTKSGFEIGQPALHQRGFALKLWTVAFLRSRLSITPAVFAAPEMNLQVAQ